MIEQRIKQMEGSKLTWETVLQFQQKDFIYRLKSIHSEFPEFTENQLSTLRYVEPYSGYCPCERIQIFLDGEWENKLDFFCDKLTYKFSESDVDCFSEVDVDNFVNYKIGKLGEEAVKIFLGDLVSNVDYELYERGDGGTDLFITNNRNIKIQVKTTAAFRVTCKQMCEFGLSEDDLFFSLLDYKLGKCSSIDSAKWIVKNQEKQKNKIIVFVLLLNPVIGEKIEDADRGYDCAIAGFMPTEIIGLCKEKFSIQDLLYCGGIRHYLLSLNST